MVRLFFLIVCLLVYSVNVINGNILTCDILNETECIVEHPYLGANDDAIIELPPGLSSYDILTVYFNPLAKPSSSVYYIPASLFTYFPNLYGLGIYTASVQEIRNNTFLNATNLQWLGLSGNNISTLGADVFRGANELSTIYLDSNQLSSIDPNAFRALSKLAELYLDNNRIVTLDSQTFSSLTNLETLSLSFNALQTLDATIFSNNAKLQFLYLNDNKINELSSQTFRVIYNNSFSLDLRNNVCVNASFNGSPFDATAQQSLESALDTCNYNYFPNTTTPLPITNSNQLLNDLAAFGQNLFAAMSSSISNINNALSNFTASVANITKYRPFHKICTRRLTVH
jgi:hypothetical protein